MRDISARASGAALAVVLIWLTAACGVDAEPETATQPATSAPAAAPPAAGGAGSGQLTGTVGTTADPEAFTITLTDSSGAEVSTLPAGDYQVTVTDLSKIHNFHLTGPGVDQTTSVRDTDEVTWNVTLEPGDYTFVCDPHPRMVGDFTVT